MPITTPNPGPAARWTSRVVVAVVVVGVLVIAGPLAGPSGWTASCAEAAEGELRIGIVVDLGTEPDAPGGPDVACVVVAAGSTSADVLRAWADGRGRSLRYAPSGLLCGIGGYPSTGCGEATSDGYRYWSYWEGTAGGWRYSGGNPHVLRASEDRVEGWRFQASTGTGADDQPPRGPSSAVCPPAPSPSVSPPDPVTTSAPVPAASVPTAPSPSPSPGVPGVPGVPGSIAVPPSSPVEGGEPDPAADPVPRPAPGVADPAADGAGSGAPDDRSATTAGSGPGSAPATDGATGAADVDLIDGTELATAEAAGGGAGGSAPLGAVAAAALVLALGVGAGVRARRGHAAAGGR